MLNTRLLLITFLLVLTCNVLLSQKILIDTISYYSYNCYKPLNKVYIYILPNSEYKRINGVVPSYDEDFKYQPYGFNIVYENQKYLSFIDFEFCINQDCFPYNYPEYRFNVDKNILIESLDRLYLRNKKDSSKFNPEEIIFILSDQTEITLNDSVISSSSELKNFKKRLYNSGGIQIRIPPITYPYNAVEDDCGQNKIRFLDLNFYLFGSDKYPEFKKE